MEARLSARNMNVKISHSLTDPRSLATWEKLKAGPGHGMPIKAGTVCHFWDKEQPKYAWLPEGWLAEQRRMPSRRLYTYYYDQSCHQYTTREEAKKKAGVPAAVTYHAHIEQGESSQNGRAMNDNINTRSVLLLEQEIVGHRVQVKGTPNAPAMGSAGRPGQRSILLTEAVLGIDGCRKAGSPRSGTCLPKDSIRIIMTVRRVRLYNTRK